MKIYNKDKTKILEEYDLKKGHLEDDVLKIHHNAVKGQEEEGHYETVMEYENGGKDVEWIIDKPYIEGQEAYDEEEKIQVYIPYTKKELDDIEKKYKIEGLTDTMNIYKQELSNSDYEAIKYAEGWFTEEEYEPIRTNREQIRVKIRELEDEIAKLEKNK